MGRRKNKHALAGQGMHAAEPAFKHKDTPGVCRVCGCTEDQACMTEDGPCGWANKERTLCTACK